MAGAAMAALTETEIERLMADMFTHVPVGAEARSMVEGLLGGADRHYHGLAHVALLWQRHLGYADHAGLTAETPMRLIASAIAYHDCIYDPRRRDNEARSAALWREHASAAGVLATETAWVGATIEATADHLGYEPRQAHWEEARLWMLDLDLSALGESPGDFARNTELLRAEYAHLAESDWIAGRAAFLASLTRRPSLFRAPVLAQVFGAAARRNIEADLREMG